MAGCSVVLISIIFIIIAIIVIIGVLAVILALSAAFFFIGIVLRKKGKKIGYVFLALGVIFLLFLGYLAFSLFGPKKENIETPTGVVGLVGVPVNISSTSSFNQATIKLTYDEDLLGNTSSKEISLFV